MSRKKKCVLEIDNLEPYFLWQFGIEIPENIKPKVKQLEDVGYDLNDPKYYDIEAFNKLREVNRKDSMLFSKYLKCDNNCNSMCRKIGYFSSHLNGMKSDPVDLLAINRYWKDNPKITWLTNKIGEEIQITGLTLDKLRELKTEIYQIGMQSTSSKEYFRYISTSEKRRVNIRMILFNQYHNISNKGNKKELGDFFSRFENFEKHLKGIYKSMIFSLDIYGSRYFELKLLDDRLIKFENFGFDIDFESWITVIKENSPHR